MSLKESYNSIATVYQASKKLPFRKYLEEFTVFQLLGNVEGKKILDLACGGGHYTRLLRQKGASKVIGVDVSPSMIQWAEDQEKSNPIGCSYICLDAVDLEFIDEFDFVVGVHLCCNAETKEQMADFAKNIYKNLKPGGSFVGIEKLNLQSPPDELSEYGIFHEYKFPLNEGDRLGISIKNQDGVTFELQTYFWQPPTYEEAFSTAGFKTFQWKGPWLDPDLPADQPPQYWEKFLSAKGLTGMYAVK